MDEKVALEVADVTAPPAAARPPQRRRLPPAEWAEWSDERLLDLRLSDLDLRIQGSSLEPLIAQVRREVAERGLRFRPHFWLSDEWFSPDGVPGVAIPFFLAHPRLARLEQSQMLEVEGGTPEWCLRILRHEVGHAVENAYGLRRLRRRRQLFGLSSQRYPQFYTPKPYSKSFVLHLDSWYAQSHPDEDFAETFAVWLTPGSDWEHRYQGWKALQKLEYMDELMKQIAGRPPRRHEPDSRGAAQRLPEDPPRALRAAARALRGGRARRLRPRLEAPLLERARARGATRPRRGS